MGMQFPDSPRDLGLVTTAEAQRPCEQGGLGLTERALRWRVDSGRWQRLHQGVYLMSTGRPDWATRAAAALLAYGDAAALCDRSAGFMHDLIEDPGEVIHVLVPRAARPQVHAGTQVHRSDQRKVTTTWPARTAYDATVIDLATSPRADDLAGLLATALRGRRTTEARLGAALTAVRRHPRRRLLQDLLSTAAEGSEGALEVRFVRDVLRRHGLPAGSGQLPASELIASARTTRGSADLPGGADHDRRRFDRAIRAQRVVFELDGRLYHQGSRRVADRRKSNWASRNGWLLLRYGWTEAVDDACLSALEILDILVERGWRGTAHGCSADCPLSVTLNRRSVG